MTSTLTIAITTATATATRIIVNMKRVVIIVVQDLKKQDKRTHYVHYMMI